jgi:hypothetical protein
MGMLGLRRPASGRSLDGKQVALDDRDSLEMPGDRLSGRKAGHAGANNHGVTSCGICHRLPPGREYVKRDRKRISPHVRQMQLRWADQAYLIFFGAMVNGVTRFGSEPTARGQLNQVANSAQVTLTAMIAGPTNR